MKPAGAACASCPARDAKGVLPESAIGRVRLAVVGDRPGREDLESGKPFSGQNGRLLGRGLRTIGVQRPQVHWTHAVLCHTADPKDLVKARKCCAARLQAELAAVGAPVVVAAGGLATQSTVGWTKSTRIEQWRGTVSQVRFQGTAADGGSRKASLGPGQPVSTSAAVPAFVMPIMDPAYVQRALPKWLPWLEIDVARVGRVLRDGWRAPEELEGRRLVIARDRDTLTAELRRLGDEIAFDVETVGLGPTHTSLVCFGFSDGPNTVVIPWSRGLNGKDAWWAFPQDVAAEVSEAMRYRTVVTHNGPAFDHIVAARYGLKIRQWEDTLLATHATHSHMPKNLAHLVSTHLDVGPWKQWDHAQDLDQCMIYNGRDLLYTIMAWKQLKETIT